MFPLSDDRRRRPAAHFTGSSLTRSELLQRGVAERDIDHALANGVLVRAARGIYLSSGEPDGASMKSVLQVLTARSGGAVSHQSAAATWGFIDDDVGPPFHVSSPARASRIRRPALVRSHYVRVPEQFIRHLEGVRVVSPAWAWLDLALQCSEERALVLADQVLMRSRRNGSGRSPLAERDDLLAAVHARG